MGAASVFDAYITISSDVQAVAPWNHQGEDSWATEGTTIYQVMEIYSCAGSGMQCCIGVGLKKPLHLGQSTMKKGDD